MGSRILTPFGRTTNSFMNDGNIHLAGAPGIVSLPGVVPEDHPIAPYYRMLGVPDKLVNKVTDELPITSQTINSAFDGSQPTQIKKYVIEATLANEMFQHFAVCIPEDAKDRIEGFGTHVLRFNVSPLNRQPEGTAPTFIRHRFESTQVKMERWGQGLEIWDDWGLLPDGNAIYKAYLNNLNTNMTYSAMMAVMTALLHAYDPKKSWMQEYAPSYPQSSFQDLGDLNRMFGGFHKREQFFYQLSDHASQVAKKMTMADKFTHVFLTSKALRQVSLADKFNHEFYRHGPGNLAALQQGSDGIRRMPDGTVIVNEPDSYVDGTELAPGETVQLLRNIVTTGRFNVCLMDRAIVGAVDDHIVPARDMGIGYLNMDLGNGEIVHQDVTALIKACICWGRNGELNRHVYNYLTSGQNAEKEAAKMGVKDLQRGNDSATLLDVFIAEHVGGVRLPVEIVGNMHTAYMNTETQNAIARSAAAAVRAEMNPEEIKAMRVAIKFANTNKNASPTSNATRAFVGGMVASMDASGSPRGRNVRNQYNVYDVPVLGDVRRVFRNFTETDAYPLDDTVVFPGFSSIKHLRTVRDFAVARSGDWFGEGGLSAAARAHLASVADGVDALYKFAAICKRIWSTDSAKNTFFRREALPYWNRSGNSAEDDIDAFLQNIVLGIGYPTGLVEMEGFKPTATEKRVAEFNFRDEGDATNAHVNDFVDLVTRVPGDSAPFPETRTRERREMLQKAANNGAFETSLVLFFPRDFRRDDDVSEKAVMDGVFEALVIEETTQDGQTRKHIGFDGLMNILTQRMTMAFDANEAAQRFLEARIRALDYVHGKMTNKGIGADGKVVLTTPEITMLISKAKTRSKGITRATAAGRDARSARDASAGEVSEGQERVVSTTLSFSGDAWRHAYSGLNEDEIDAMRLVAADPMQPTSWLGQGGRSNADERAREFYGLGARAQFDIDSTCMGKVAGAAFVEPAAARRGGARQPAQKRAAYAPAIREEFGASLTAGASYFYDPPAQDPYAGMPSDLRRRAQLDESGDVDTPRVDLNDPYGQGPHRRAVSGDAVIQDANAHFEWRWQHAIANFTSDVILLSQHLLLLGTRVHRDSFVNLVENGVPAPVGFIAADPFVKFAMTSAVFARAGCGSLYYAFPKMSNTYDGNHKVLQCFLTVWMKAVVHLPEDVYVAENIAFDGYLGGGDGSLIHNIYVENDQFAGQPAGGWGFAYNAPKQRRGNRFVLAVGPSTKVNDIPNPLPLGGTFSGSGAYHGVGRFINTHNGGPRRGGFAYDSALVANYMCKFYLLNRRLSPTTFTDAASFVERTNLVGNCLNTVCYKADQWARDHGDGGYKRRVMTGDGPVEKTSEGIMIPYSGKIGLAQYVNGQDKS